MPAVLVAALKASEEPVGSAPEPSDGAAAVAAAEKAVAPPEVSAPKAAATHLAKPSTASVPPKGRPKSSAKKIETAAVVPREHATLADYTFAEELP